MRVSVVNESESEWMKPRSSPPGRAPSAAQGPDVYEERFTSVLAACDEALAAGIDSVPTESADSAPELRDRLARTVACVRLLREALPGPVRTGAHPTDQRLGDFELGRELGRGGMGVVYGQHWLTRRRT